MSTHASIHLRQTDTAVFKIEKTYPKEGSMSKAPYVTFSIGSKEHDQVTVFMSEVQAEALRALFTGFVSGSEEERVNGYSA